MFYYIVVRPNLQKEQGNIQGVLLSFLERQMQCRVLTGNQAYLKKKTLWTVI